MDTKAQPPKLTGIGLVLKSMGIDPTEMLTMFETLKTALPAFAQKIAGEVKAMNESLQRIEANQAEILRRLPAASEPPAMTVAIAAQIEQLPAAMFKPATDNGSEHTTTFQFERQDGNHGSD